MRMWFEYGVKKERRELELRAMTVNERAAAAARAGTAVNIAIKEHTKDLLAGFQDAIAELEEARTEIKQLMDTRQGLLERNKLLQKQVQESNELLPRHYHSPTLRTTLLRIL